MEEIENEAAKRHMARLSDNADHYLERTEEKQNKTVEYTKILHDSSHEEMVVSMAAFTTHSILRREDIDES